MPPSGINKTIEKILNLQQILLNKVKNYKHTRFLFETLKKEIKSKIITGISGLRGSGKTVLLLQLLEYLHKNKQKAIYISADMFSQEVDFFELIETLIKNYKIKYFLLDEVHYIKEWARLLKNMYDIYEPKIFFTSSVSLDILNTRVDLARRVKIINLPVLSYREYLLFKHNKKYSTKSFDEILTRGVAQRKKLHTADGFLEGYFLEYLKTPLPAILDTEPYSIINTIIDTIIFKDIANNQNLATSELQLLKKILEFLSVVPGGDISISAIANSFKITKYKASLYIDILEKAFLVHKVMPYGRNVLKEPKILLNIPFRVYLSQNINKLFDFTGPLKEDFFVSTIRGSASKRNIELYYLKSKRGKKTPDFYVREAGREPCVVEVGGKKKGFSQFKGVETECKIIAAYPFVLKQNVIPLYEFGFLY